MQWNCAGLQLRHAELSFYLKHNPIPILALSEAGLPKNFTLTGYFCYNNPTMSGFPNGSASLFIRKTLPQQQIDTKDLCTQDMEITAARVMVAGQNLCVTSVYVRAGKSGIKVADLVKGICQRCNDPIILCGDWNAHHSLWGGSRDDTRGRTLIKCFEEYNLAVANDGSPTFFRPPDTYSAIDITAHSIDLCVNWTRYPDTMGSDHYPIFISLNGVHGHQQRSRNVIHWDLFRTHLETCSESILNAILVSAEKATTKICLPEHYPEPDLQLLNLCAARRQAQRKLQRKYTSTNKTALNRINAATRRYAKKAKRKHWEDNCAAADANKPGTQIWRILDVFMGKRDLHLSHAAMAFRLGTNLQEAAETFADQFCSIQNETVKLYDPVTTSSPLDEDFSLEELKYALKASKRKSAPGPDGITNQMLQNITEERLQELLTVFNCIWASGDIPEEWRTAWVVPIHKPGKPHNITSSYRPISLTSCVMKTMEKMIHNRITWWLETSHLLPHGMTGFRRGLSTQDNILDLLSSIEQSHHDKKSTLAIFFDIAKAYDNVDPAVVFEKLTEVGITGRIQIFLKNALANRKLKVRLGSSFSTSRSCTRGLPQGSVLSPILFNIVLAGLPRCLPKYTLPINISMYADDICIWVSAYRHHGLRNAAQAAITTSSNYLDECGLQFSPEKTAFILFLGKGRRSTKIDLTLYNFPLRRVRQHKFLGITINSRLNWHTQARNVMKSSLTARNAIRRVAGQSWGNSPRSMIRLHSALVVSRIVYSLPFMRLSPTDSQALERIHRQGLRTCLGVPTSTKNEKVYEEARALTLPLLATKCLLRQIIRLGTTPAGRNLLHRLTTRQNSRFYISWKTLQHLEWTPETLQEEDNSPTTPPWKAYYPNCVCHVPGVRNKFSAHSTVIKQKTIEYISNTYTNYLQVYTDGSVNRSRRSSACAFHIPSLELEWCGRLDDLVSSTTAEMYAIVEALRRIAQLTPQAVLVLTDSRAALQQLQRAQETSKAAMTAKSDTQLLESSGFKILYQWIPAHVGIEGNEKADKLASNAHNLPTSVHVPEDRKRFYQIINEHIYSLSIGHSSTTQPCLTRNLRRAEATLLFRLRTGCARTGQLLHRWKKRNTDKCPLCDETEDLKHLLEDCRRFEEQRKDLAAELKRHHYIIQDVEEIIYPSGTRARRKSLQRILLNFLRATGLHAQL